MLVMHYLYIIIWIFSTQFSINSELNSTTTRNWFITTADFIVKYILIFSIILWIVSSFICNRFNYSECCTQLYMWIIIEWTRNLTQVVKKKTGLDFNSEKNLTQLGFPSTRTLLRGKKPVCAFLPLSHQYPRIPETRAIIQQLAKLIRERLIKNDSGAARRGARRSRKSTAVYLKDICACMPREIQGGHTGGL